MLNSKLIDLIKVLAQNYVGRQLENIESADHKLSKPNQEEEKDIREMNQ